MQMTITNENSTIEKITTVFESLRSIITNHENELKQKVRSIEKRNQDLVENFQKQLRNKQEELSKRNKDFERCLSLKDHTKLLQNHVKLNEYSKTTTQELMELKYPIKTQYCIEEIDQLQAAITNIVQGICIIEWQQGNSKFRFSSVFQKRNRLTF